MRDTYVKKYGLIKYHLFTPLFLFTSVTDVLKKTPEYLVFVGSRRLLSISILWYFFIINTQLMEDDNNLVCFFCVASRLIRYDYYGNVMS